LVQEAKEDGLVIDHRLTSGRGQLGRWLPRERKPRRLQPKTTVIEVRGEGLRPGPVVRAFCSPSARFCLPLIAELPGLLKPGRLQARLHGTDKRLDTVGLTFEAKRNRLRLRAATPEGAILFSACLAQGKKLLVCPDGNLPPWRIVVGLHDFE